MYSSTQSSEYEEEQWEKAIGQFRLALNGILAPLRLYGQGLYVDSAMEEIVSLAIQLHLKLYGVDIPFQVNHEKLHY